MKMRKDSSAENSPRRPRRKLIYVKSVAEIPDFKSDDEIAAWYQSHSTVLIQDQLETLPARGGGRLRSRLLARRSKVARARKARPHSQSAS
jgi:hypothetical protein